MPEFVVTTGLTRRLVSATSRVAARDLFEAAVRGNLVPGVTHTTNFERGELKIREATEAEVAEFGSTRHRPKLVDQLAWDLPEVPRRKRRRRNSGEHA